MRFIKVFLLVLIFFFFTCFVSQNHTVLGQNLSFRLDFFVLPVYESIPLPLYFIVLIAFLVGALVCLLILLGDRLRAGFALRKARKRINVLEQEVALLRALPLREGELNKELISELAPPSQGLAAEKNTPLGKKTNTIPLPSSAENKPAQSPVNDKSENKNDRVDKF